MSYYLPRLLHSSSVFFPFHPPPGVVHGRQDRRPAPASACTLAFAISLFPFLFFRVSSAVPLHPPSIPPPSPRQAWYMDDKTDDQRLPPLAFCHSRFLCFHSSSSVSLPRRPPPLHPPPGVVHGRQDRRPAPASSPRPQPALLPRNALRSPAQRRKINSLSPPAVYPDLPSNSRLFQLGILHWKLDADIWKSDPVLPLLSTPHVSPALPRVSLVLRAELGILYWKLDADIWDSDPQLKQIRKERNYSYEEVVNIHPDTLPNYEQKLKSFYEEHIHTDEEIRYILDGSGYFDVRDFEDRWIRIHTKKGDLIVLPAGIYHRFTLDSTNYVKALRLFVGEPVWTPYNRPADEMAARKEYLEKFAIRTATAVA
ncbi:unnamed protein product [Closterium sp. NIES-65]|nr:unnamed protein product [Closterium sp. NIES-65]